MAARITKIPYGYRIENGRAVIDPVASEKLKLYFRRYLSGKTMAEAAQEAGLTCSPATYPNLFRRREYLGDEYYPGLIDEDYQKQLISEWERRKKASRRKSSPPVRTEVKIHTSFREIPLNRHRQEEELPEDPYRRAEVLYRRLAACT